MNGPCHCSLTLAQTILSRSLRLSSRCPSGESWAESWGSLERQEVLQSSSADTYRSHWQLGRQDQTDETRQTAYQAIYRLKVIINVLITSSLSRFIGRLIEKYKWDSHAHLHIQSSSMLSTGDITGVEGRWHTLSGCCQTYLSCGTPSVRLKHTHKKRQRHLKGLQTHRHCLSLHHSWLKTGTRVFPPSYSVMLISKSSKNIYIYLK